MGIFITAGIVAILIAVFVIVQKRKNERVFPVSGGVYTTKEKNGRFHVIKVLALSKKGFVHYLHYPSEFPQRPETLQISVMADRPGHCRVETKKFHQLYPKQIGRIRVNPREIQRYLRPKAS